MRLRAEVTQLRFARRKEAQPGAARTETEDQVLVNQQVTIEAKFAKLPAPVLKKMALEAIGIDISGAGLAAILTDPQMRSLMHAFEQHKICKFFFSAVAAIRKIFNVEIQRERISKKFFVKFYCKWREVFLKFGLHCIMNSLYNGRKIFHIIVFNVIRAGILNLEIFFTGSD